jgi:hypothetical protein
MINPGSVIKFSDVLIGPTGQSGIEIRPSTDPATGLGLVNAGAGGDLANGNRIVLTDTASFARSGLREVAGGLNLVGGAGFNSALRENLAELNRSGFGGRVGRMER